MVTTKNFENVTRIIKGSIRSAEFSGDAQFLATIANPQGEPALFHFPTNSAIQMPRFSQVNHIAFRPDVSEIAIADGSASVSRYSPSLGAMLKGIPTPGNSSLAYSQDGNMLAVGTVTGAIELWGINEENLNPRLLKRISLRSAPIVSLSFAAHDCSLFAGTTAGTVYRVILLQDLKEEKPAAVLSKIESMSGRLCLSASPVEPYLAGGGFDGSLKIHDYRAKMQWTKKCNVGSFVRKMHFADTESMLAVVGEQAVELWDTRSFSCTAPGYLPENAKPMARYTAPELGARPMCASFAAGKPCIAWATTL